jgi:hypothetical protein
MIPLDRETFCANEQACWKRQSLERVKLSHAGSEARSLAQLTAVASLKGSKFFFGILAVAMTNFVI